MLTAFGFSLSWDLGLWGFGMRVAVQGLAPRVGGVRALVLGLGFPQFF